RVAKFMPLFDGPYKIVDAHPESSVFTSPPPQTISQHYIHLSWCPIVERFMVLNREILRPGPIVTSNGEDERIIDCILDELVQYLVRWVGHGPDDGGWLLGRMLRDGEALDIW
ncbi:hypothetical protein JAAARDRAFT_142553, partial [Jaapia argillacea MUCL 33604]